MVDWCQKIVDFLLLPLLLPQASEAHGRPQFQRLCALTAGRIGLALLGPPGTPPGGIFPRFSRCPFLLDHNTEVRREFGRSHTISAAVSVGL